MGVYSKLVDRGERNKESIARRAGNGHLTGRARILVTSIPRKRKHHYRKSLLP